MATQYVKKITTATTGLDSSVLDAAAKGTMDKPVMRVYGFLTGSESGKSQFGEYIAFKGEFEAENLLTGQVYRSGRLIVPPVAEMALAPEIEAIADGQRVKFGLVLNISENKSDKGGRKYKFGVQPLIEPSTDDELAKLRKALPDLSEGSTTAKKSKR